MRANTDDNYYHIGHNIVVVQNIYNLSFSQGVISMTVSAIPIKNTRFKIGWIILLVSAALFTLGHLSLIFAFAIEQTLFRPYCFHPLCFSRYLNPLMNYVCCWDGGS
jgi:hypothetical protein